MAYTYDPTLQGLLSASWNPVGSGVVGDSLPMGYNAADYTTNYYKADPNVNYGPAPVAGAQPAFDQQGRFIGFGLPGSGGGSGSGLFGDMGGVEVLGTQWIIDPATGQLSGPSQMTQTPSQNGMTKFMSYAMPVAMMAGLGYGAAGGAFGGAGGAASGGSAAPATAIPGMNAGGGWGLTGGMEALGGGVGSTVGSGSLGELMAGGLTGGGGASGGLGAGGAASGGGGLSSLFGGGSGGGMSSFLPSTLGEWGSTIGNLLPLIGAVGGAAQGSQNQTITNQTQLPPWLQALGPQLTNAAIGAANQPFQPYGGQRIEPFNPTQQAAFGMVQNRAMNGSPVERAGQDAVTRAATGNANPMFGLNNPALNQQIDNTLGDLNRNFERTVLPNIDAMNTRANTGFGTSSAINDAGGLRSEAYRNLNETAAKTANDMRYKDYYTQTQLGEGMAGRQLQAAGLAPNLGAVDYRNADALLGIGNQQQQLGQQGQDFNYQEFLRQLQYPDQQLQRLGYPFGFQQGSTTTSTQPGVGAVAGGISGLLGGIGMSNMIGRGGTAVSGPATMTPPPRTTLPSNGYGLDGFYPYAWGGA